MSPLFPGADGAMGGGELLWFYQLAVPAVWGLLPDENSKFMLTQAEETMVINETHYEKAGFLHVP